MQLWDVEYAVYPRHPRHDHMSGPLCAASSLDDAADCGHSTCEDIIFGGCLACSVEETRAMEFRARIRRRVR
jgi:hypothetical protein